MYSRFSPDQRAANSREWAAVVIEKFSEGPRNTPLKFLMTRDIYLKDDYRRLRRYKKLGVEQSWRFKENSGEREGRRKQTKRYAGAESSIHEERNRPFSREEHERLSIYASIYSPGCWRGSQRAEQTGTIGSSGGSWLVVKAQLISRCAKRTYAQPALS